jgi:hypothetical protein|tara:strand:+ start:64 stop:261 length:198 start_codon:yes stop_codon:yes gene_type:complete
LKFKKFFYLSIVVLIIVGHFSISDASAYMDPNSITLAIQLLAAALIGGGITLKLYWQRIKMKFLK